MKLNELIDKYEGKRNKNLSFELLQAYIDFIRDLEQLDEQKPVKVPSFVADWISFVKTNGINFKNTYGFYEEITPSDDVYRVMYYIFKESIADKGIRKWVADNIDTFARAWLDGYEVEKEKLYLVKIKGVNEECEYLVFGEISNTWKLRSLGSFGELRKHHTRKELKEAGFGWVFDCPGIEIEEMEHENKNINGNNHQC